MDQGWKRLPLLVVFLLFWKNAHGYTYSTNPTAVKWWGQPSDNTFLPLEVQSSMPEAPVTGVLVEEVVSSLPKNRPKFNLLQVVKGGVSSSSESTPQTLTPNTASSASSLPTDQSGMSGLVSLQGSSGSNIAYAAGGSGQVVFSQGDSGSFLKTVLSGQSTNDRSSPSSSNSASQGTTYGVVTQGTGQFAQGSSFPYASISLPKYVTSQLITGPGSEQFTSVYGTQTGSSAPFTLPGSTTYGGPIQTQDATSSLVSGSSTPYIAVSMPQAVTSPSTVPSSKQITSVYSSPTGSSALFTLQGLLQGQDSSSPVVSGSSAPYVAASFPQVATSQLTSTPSSKQITSVFSTQTGSSGPFTLQRLVQAQDTTSQVVSGSSSPYVAVSLPQGVTSQSTTVPSSTKFINSIYGTPTRSSALFTLQGPLQRQDSTSKVVSVSSPYVAVSLPQAVTSPSGGPSLKQIKSVYSTQTGSSAPFTLQRLVQAQDSTSQVVSGSSPYVAVSLPEGVTSQSTTVPSSKQITTVFNTETGSSAPFTLQGSTTYSGLLQAQDSASQISVPSTPYVTVSLPQGVISQSVVPSSQQITSVYGPETGSSASFTLQGSTTYGGLIQAQDSASQVVSGSSTPYVAVSLPQGISQLTTVPSSKQVTAVYGTQTGSSAPITLQGLLQGQGSTSQVVSGSSPYVAVSLPQGIISQSTTVPSSKPVTAVYGTQTGSSAPFILQGLLQGQGSTSHLVSGSSPYVAVSLPQGVTKQVTSVYNTQTGSSPTLNLQVLQPQDATDQFSTGSSSSVLQTSTADASNPSSSFSTLRRYYSVKD